MNGTPYVFILAGGRGERLWPLSSAACRKPFIKLFEGKSLLELTLARLEGFVPLKQVRILTAQELRDAVREAVPGFPEAQILCEPEGRNTAAALAYACGCLRQESPDAIGVVLPADHLIQDTTAFQAALTAACELAEARQEIVTVGIEPTAPATAYGYIACGAALETRAGCRTCEGAGFTEKPDLATAKAYLNTGNFLWNAGIFVWTAETLYTRFRADAPAFLPLIEAPTKADAFYPQLPAIAFDYAIMEPCPAFSVVRGTFDWDDAGTFAAIERHLPADAAGNCIAGCGQCDHTANTTLLSTAPNHRVILSGVEGLFIAHTPQVTLICPRNEVARAQAFAKQLDKSTDSFTPSSRTTNE